MPKADDAATPAALVKIIRRDAVGLEILSVWVIAVSFPVRADKSWEPAIDLV